MYPTKEIKRDINYYSTVQYKYITNVYSSHNRTCFELFCHIIKLVILHSKPQHPHQFEGLELKQLNVK